MGAAGRGGVLGVCRQLEGGGGELEAKIWTSKRGSLSPSASGITLVMFCLSIFTFWDFSVSRGRGQSGINRLSFESESDSRSGAYEGLVQHLHFAKVSEEIT